jgi:hypothetical protein
MGKAVMWSLLITAAMGLTFVDAEAIAQTNDPQHERLERDIERMQREIIERNQAAQQRAQEQIREQEQQQQREREREREREYRYQDQRHDEERERRERNGVIILNPPAPQNGGMVIVNPPSQTRVIWAEPIIPNIDRSAIIMRGEFDRQPSPSCQLEQWREGEQLYQRWHCPPL